MLEDDIVKQSKILQGYGANRSVANSFENELEQWASNSGDVTDKLDANTVIAQQNQAKQEDKDINLMGETLGAVGAGVLKGVQNLGNFAIDVADWVDEAVGTGRLIDEDDRMTALTNPRNVYQPQTTGGRIIQEVSAFLLPFGGISKATKGIKATGYLARLAKSGSIGAAVDFMAYDPHEERLSNLVQKIPSLSNPVSEYLAADPDDSNAEGRFKNTAEGLLLGLGAEFLVDGLVKGVKAVRANRGVKESVKEAAEIKNIADARGVTDDEGLEAIRKEITPEVEDIDLTPLEKIGEVTEEQAFRVAKRLGEDPEKFAGNINLSKIESGEDVQKVLNSTAQEFKLSIDEASREVITEKEMSKLADDLGLTMNELLERKAGQSFNAEELIASRRMLVTSAEVVFDLAKKAGAPGASKIEKAQLMAALGKHRVIHAQVSGAVAEAGRALKSQQIKVGGLSAANKVKFLDDFLSSGGGEAGVDQISKRMVDIIDKDGVKGLSRTLERSNGRFIKDAVFETWINSILSGPKTHLTNILSNSTVVASSIVERGFARGSALARGATDSVQEGEVYAMFSGLFSGFMDGLELGAKALKEGTGSAKIDVQISPLSAKSVANQFPSTSRFLLGEDGGLTLIGKGIEALSQINTLPSRFLLAEDEFFKAINMRMELHALATRRARQVGAADNLSEPEIMKLITDTINNPPADLTQQTLDFAKTNTFTNDLAPGSFGETLTLLRDKEVLNTGIAPLKAVIPFVRTPLNLITFALDRTPVKFGQLVSDFKAGGVRKDMAMARVGLGTGVLGTLGFFGSNGTITGGGPRNPRARKFLENSGWRPYSFKIGDNYVQYDRLDPFGGLLATAADMGEIFNEIGDQKEFNKETVDLLAMGVGSVVSNLTPEFMMENLSQFLETLLPGRDQERAIQNFVSKQASGAVPLSAFFRSITQTADPTKRETRADPNSPFPLLEETINKMKANIPGMSKDLPPKRNVFGEELEIPGSINPLSTTKAKNDKVIDTLIELGMNSVQRDKEPEPGETHLMIDMPQRFITKSVGLGKSETIRLNPEQYDRLVKLSAGIELRSQPIPGKTLKEALAQEINKGFPTARMASGTKSVSDEVKRLVLKQIISSYRKAGKNQFLEEERTVQDDLRNRFEERQRALRIR